MRWQPRVVYNAPGVTINFLLPQHFWEPEEGAGFGDEDISAGGVPLSYVVRYDQMVNVVLRWRETEHVAVMTWLEWCMKNKGIPFTFRLDQNDAATEYSMYLHSPKTGEMLRPRRPPNAPHTRELDMTLRTSNGARVHNALVIT